LKVLFTTSAQEGFGGGMGRISYELARAFAERVQVGILVPDEDSGTLRDDAGVTRIRVAGHGEGELLQPIVTPSVYRSILRRLDEFSPDVVHAHDYDLLSVIGQVWALRRGVPLFFSIHKLPTEFFAFNPSPLEKTPLRTALLRLANAFQRRFHRNCAALVAMNRQAQESLDAFGHSGRRYQIPNGRFLAPYLACRPADAASPGRRLLYVGNLCERKNQRFLVRAMRHLPATWELVLIGPALDHDYASALHREAQRSRVRVLGRVEQSRIPDELEKAHVLVSASTAEVQSLVVIEALASGTPVVGLGNATIDELVDPSVGRRLPADATPARFAQAVREVCDLAPEGYLALCRSARRRVRHLDWSETVEATLGMYESYVRGVDGRARIQPRRAPIGTLVSRDVLVVGSWIHRMTRPVAATPPSSSLPYGPWARDPIHGSFCRSRASRPPRRPDP
jgi:glycosyltransferase involved in cell wall biosynthesis